MTRMQIGVIIGSLRKNAWSRKLAAQLIHLAPDTLEFQVIEIGKMPFYNEDDETATPPESWVEFRKQVQAMDGILFVTPEYNRSVPAALKNAIDVGSRPYGKSAWNKKVSAVVSNSPGAIGGFGASHHLRQSLVFLNMPCMPFEAYIGGVNQLLNDKGDITKPETETFLRGMMQTYSDWVQRNKS